MAVVLFSCLNPIGPFVCLTIHLFVILLLLSLSETAMSKMTFTSDRAQFAKLTGAVTAIIGTFIIKTVSYDPFTLISS